MSKGTDRSLRERFRFQTLDCIIDFRAESSAVIALTAATLWQHPSGFLRAHHG
jgi:hypothetical protein